MMKKKILIILAVILLISMLAAIIYAGNMFGFFNRGNSMKYSVKNTDKSESPLEGKTIIFLGSSVTKGFASKGESFVDFMVKEDGINAVKEAKSGTTLVDSGKDSYVSRMKTIDKEINADLFVCQLSTNDATQNKELGKISDSFELSDFETSTVAGAIEYIICYAKSTWDCPVVFYTNPRYDSKNYEDMVELLSDIQNKWDIYVIDLWNNEELNSLSKEEKKTVMNDDIHPTRKGYRDYWMPVMRENIQKFLKV